jgi:hypothetical protein
MFGAGPGFGILQRIGRLQVRRDQAIGGDLAFLLGQIGEGVDPVAFEDRPATPDDQ